MLQQRLTCRGQGMKKSGYHMIRLLGVGGAGRTEEAVRVFPCAIAPGDGYISFRRETETRR